MDSEQEIHVFEVDLGLNLIQNDKDFSIDARTIKRFNSRSIRWDMEKNGKITLKLPMITHNFQ